MTQAHIDTILSQLKPMLATHGRDITVLESSDKKVKLGLTGFCGGCGCSTDYVEGLKEMLGEQFPDTEFEFEVA